MGLFKNRRSRTKEPDIMTGHVAVEARIIGPMIQDVLVKEISVPKSDSPKGGVVYVIRRYKDGKPDDYIVDKKIWDDFRTVLNGIG